MTQPEPQTPAAPESQQAAAPPWGNEEDFDPAKAWKLIEGLRADKEALAKRPVLTDEAKAQLAEFEQQKAKNQTELEKANEAVTRWQTDAEKWRGTAVAAKVEAIAATDFVSVNDAVKSVDPAKYLDAGGNIDETAIKADLAKVLEENPHYRREEGAAPRVPAPNASQGSGVNGRPAPNPAQEFAAILGGQLGG